MFGLIPYTAKLANREATRNLMNPFSDDFFRTFFESAPEARSLNVDVLDKGDHYLLEADLPGVSKEDVRVSIDEGVLTIATETNQEKEDKDKNYIYHERRYGRTCRSFNLDGIKESDISAEYKDGVLRLTLPKSTEAAPSAREIEIN